MLERLPRHEDEIAISSIVWHELRFGAERLPLSDRRSAIERYLGEIILMSMPILDYDRPAAEWHASERPDSLLAANYLRSPTARSRPSLPFTN